MPSPFGRIKRLPQRRGEAALPHAGLVARVLQKSANVLLYAVVLLLVFVAYGSVPNRWYKVITIEGNSMSPTLKYGDLIIITRAPRSIEPGTIVTLQVENAVVTHRFIGYDENGRRVFKGDANEQPDDFRDTEYTIVGVYRFRIPLLGHINLQANRALNGGEGPTGADQDVR